MRHRILDIAEQAAGLKVRHGALEIRLDQDGPCPALIPFDEIAVIIAAHRQIHCTRSVLSELSRAGGLFIVCDDKHLPVGMMLPLNGHHVIAERIALQASASKPTCKRLWQQIVRAKINAQAQALLEIRNDDFGLKRLLALVRSGDPDNIEARAARTYWPALFDDPRFLRRREKEDQNRLLNYGYAVLRALTARAICAAGLQPCLGIHHHNRYNPFNLADDLMEPFRPRVDLAVVRIVLERGASASLDAQTKQQLIEPLMAGLQWDQEQRQLADVLARIANQLVEVFAGRERRLHWPKW